MLLWRIRLYFSNNYHDIFIFKKSNTLFLKQINADLFVLNSKYILNQTIVYFLSEMIIVQKQNL